jgi:hypothetical protein
MPQEDRTRGKGEEALKVLKTEEEMEMAKGRV